jgi:hypothetical protein
VFVLHDTELDLPLRLVWGVDEERPRHAEKVGAVSSECERGDMAGGDVVVEWF